MIVAEEMTKTGGTGDGDWAKSEFRVVLEVDGDGRGWGARA